MAICSEGSNAVETAGMTTLTSTTSSTRIAVKKISLCRTVLLGLFVAGDITGFIIACSVESYVGCCIFH